MKPLPELLAAAPPGHVLSTPCPAWLDGTQPAVITWVGVNTCAVKVEGEAERQLVRKERLQLDADAVVWLRSTWAEPTWRDQAAVRERSGPLRPGR